MYLFIGTYFEWMQDHLWEQLVFVVIINNIAEDHMAFSFGDAMRLQIRRVVRSWRFWSILFASINIIQIYWFKYSKLKLSDLPDLSGVNYDS